MVVTCMAMVLCVSCKKDNDKPTGSGTINGHEWVDLGLPSGTLWATTNVGANTPEAYGSYFAWGEITTKDYYSWDNYKWCNGSFYKLTKYNTDSYYGTVDGITTLEMADDAARVNWGGAWRTPTYDEMQELKDNCTSEWIVQNGVNGRKFTGHNGSSIFLPAAGYYDEGNLRSTESCGYYVSSSLGNGCPSYSFYLDFFSRDVSMRQDHRLYGRQVRPVCNPQ